MPAAAYALTGIGVTATYAAATNPDNDYTLGVLDVMAILLITYLIRRAY